jgi:hypothetical protein
MVCDCDTRVLLRKDYGRTIEMYLYKNHYLIYKKLPITNFFIEHYEEICEEYPDMPLKKAQKILNMNGGKCKFSEIEYNPMRILRCMFNNNRFTEIAKYDPDLLKTSEYNNELPEYTDLEYSEDLCCKEVLDTKVAQKYNYVVYADFESDVTVNPHKAYICCCVWYDSDDQLMSQTFHGSDCAKQLLRWLPNDSCVYFHNLKYDASFFMNVNTAYNIDIIENNGTIMELKFREFKAKKKIVFRNSNSIIPSPLRDFSKMFNLEVEKDICPYKLYTQENLKLKWIPIETCMQQVIDESLETNKDLSVAHQRADYSNSIVKILIVFMKEDMDKLLIL